MKNFVSEGKTADFTASGQSYVSGQPAPFGAEGWGICVVDIADGATGTMSLTGVFTLKKKASLAIAQGDRLFWDPAAKEITKTDADGTYIGCAMAAVAGAGTLVDVNINRYMSA